VKPRIGLTSSYSPDNDSQVLPANYVRAIEQAGGIPLIVPAGISGNLAGDVLDRMDGLLLSGGPDLDPALFGEAPHQRLGQVSPERDIIEIPLTQAALARGVPILAICRGIQTLNVSAGGTLIQDIVSLVPGALKHRQEAPRWHGSHGVQIEPGSLIAALLGTTEIRVNTFHHQCVKAVAPGFKITARAPDGVIEGIEGPGGFVLGVQWHPEGMFERVPVFAGLFRGLVEAASGPKCSRAKAASET